MKKTHGSFVGFMSSLVQLGQVVLRCVGETRSVGWNFIYWSNGRGQITIIQQGCLPDAGRRSHRWRGQGGSLPLLVQGADGLPVPERGVGQAWAVGQAAAWHTVALPADAQFAQLRHFGWLDRWVIGGAPYRPSHNRNKCVRHVWITVNYWLSTAKV